MEASNKKPDKKTDQGISFQAFCALGRTEGNTFIRHLIRPDFSALRPPMSKVESNKDIWKRQHIIDSFPPHQIF